MIARCPMVPVCTAITATIDNATRTAAMNSQRRQWMKVLSRAVIMMFPSPIAIDVQGSHLSIYHTIYLTSKQTSLDFEM